MTVATDPTYPVADDLITLSLSAPIGNAVQGELTSVPTESALTVGLLLDDATGLPIATFTPDVAGAYGVSVHDYLTSTRVPSYFGDPAGGSVSLYKNTETATVYVGVVEELPIVTLQGHGATLQLTVTNATVRAAELVSPLSDVSRKALIDTAVVAALTALVGVAVASIDVGFVADVVALRNAYENHRVQVTGSIHYGADSTNVARRETPSSIEAAIATLNDLYDVIGLHQTQGPAGGTWHANDDGINNIVTARAKSLGQATVTKSDLRERCFERHRVQVGAAALQVHGAADNTLASIMAAPLTLPALIVAFLDAIVAESTATPAGEQTGAVAIEHGFGFSPR
jgi:hypothetical protein